jgi:hypothetical protein
LFTVRRTAFDSSFLLEVQYSRWMIGCLIPGTMRLGTVVSEACHTVSMRV